MKFIPNHITCFHEVYYELNNLFKTIACNRSHKDSNKKITHGWTLAN